MKRRAFLSMLAGAAGATLVPWRGTIEPVVVLPKRPLIAAWPPELANLDAPIGTVIYLVNADYVPRELLERQRPGDLVYFPGEPGERERFETAIKTSHNRWIRYGDPIGAKGEQAWQWVESMRDNT